MPAGPGWAWQAQCPNPLESELAPEIPDRAKLLCNLLSHARFLEDMKAEHCGFKASTKFVTLRMQLLLSDFLHRILD